ncbi:PREDICTED: inducible metalloproteinase inhibitor protein-like [Papilio polytes]|uniref:inducible metalloproteinase inhibitor protein-like n=1 Tax=Papilio polytes TaxID=76194 RepID=UPI000676A660|nr:PREDICTED: inducible metalloproteinase inhibitor protein-like [Papilio polytes]
MNPTPCADRVCPRSLKALREGCITHANIKLPPKCVCRFNYSRDRRGRCIPTHSCPPIACGHNEIFDACPPLCPSDDCSQATPSGRCPIIGRIGIVVQCKPQCRCAYHYWRKDNICVPYEQCNITPIIREPRSCNATTENI